MQKLAIAALVTLPFLYINWDNPRIEVDIDGQIKESRQQINFEDPNMKRKTSCNKPLTIEYDYGTKKGKITIDSTRDNELKW